MKARCAVTGASGYVGGVIAERLAREWEVVRVGRPWRLGEGLDLDGAEALVHAAWDFGDPQGSVAGSRRLFEDARAAGVRRVVFISSIAAFAEARSAYGRAKLAVEEMVLERGGTVVRPGLVWGERAGGMFGALRAQAARGGVVPMVGDGNWAQFLVHEDDLAEVVGRVLASEEYARRVLTVAHRHAWALRELISQMSAGRVRLVGVPWRVVYAGLRVAEAAGVRVGFRSDSVLGLVYGNPGLRFDDREPVSLREFG